MSTKPIEEIENTENVEVEETEAVETEQTNEAASEDRVVDGAQEFHKEASQVPVPQSVAMNSLRTDINNAIARSPLHIECILEIFRTTCDVLEKNASEVARQEAMAYDSQIMELRQKYHIP